MACITEAAIGFPNASGTVPPENGMLSEILGEAGWNTYMVGKWHLCPTDEMSLAATRRNWPTGRGFERWYGFLGAETNQWYPDLVYDNHTAEQPSSPEEGHHLTEDITDKALEFNRDAKAITPEKPFCLYHAPGACHAPHHAPKEWIEKFKGRFDMGYEAMREQTLARQTQLGIVPANTEVPPINPIGTPETRKGPDGQPFTEVGWAMAFNTPFKMWKRHEFNGGTSDPCVISWPVGIKARGEVREQYFHAIDLVPTILDVLRVEAPETIKGHTQSPFDGVSMRDSFDDASAASKRTTQFYAMLGSRSIWHEGWKPVTTHPCLSGWGHFNDDDWELYHTDVDRAEINNLAGEHPEKVRELVNLWFSEAGANGAFPLDDRSVIEIASTPRPQLSAPRDRYVFFPGDAPVGEWQAVNTKNRSFVIEALADLPETGAQGVLFAFGTRFGGHALYVKDDRLHYVNSFVGAEEQMVVSSQDIPAGENLFLSASFEKEGQEPTYAYGTLLLYHGDTKVGEGKIKTQLGFYAIAGSSLFVGRQPGEPVTDDYPGESPYTFTGGLKLVPVNVSGKPFTDLERHVAMLLKHQ